MTATAAWGTTAPDSVLAPFPIDRRTLRDEDVAIEITHCGVCHSDLHAGRNDWGRTNYPFVPGHEIVGFVTAVGAGVTSFKVGDRAAVGTCVDSCRKCDACEDNEEQYCREGVTGTYNSKDRIDGSPTYGGYSKSIVVAEPYVLRVPESLDMALAAPLLCAGITSYSPLKNWNVGPGTKVGVIGLGGLGHMGVKFAKALGAEVTMITTSPAKGEDARKLGADHVLVSSDKAAMKAATRSFDFPTRFCVRHTFNSAFAISAMLRDMETPTRDSKSSLPSIQPCSHGMASNAQLQHLAISAPPRRLWLTGTVFL